MTADATIPAHSCPVCGESARITLLCRADGQHVYTCATCSADHVFPVPSAADLKAYYDRAEWFEGGEKGGYKDYDAHNIAAADHVGALLAPFAGHSNLSILDLGCGYGTHLAAAAKAGWRCFGVEPSAHARKVAQERLGGAAYIVETISDLIPHEFDVVLMLDVIEHLPSPYPSFYLLYSIGAITPKTTVIITTPNAGSREAKRDPAGWPFRHPASHLIHYTCESLTHVLKHLHFSEVEVTGLGEAPALADCAGLLVTAQGSDFAEFMRERYVPGTWSKLAEYEHLPRYALAKSLASNKAVLDFGCGTGYGSAIMAQTAARVTGLDINTAALSWAEASHHNPRLTFRRHDDLGASLPAASFDIVTCFEMIEHIDHTTQKAAIASMTRLLKCDGLLVISTPNPDVTALYGANPYHLREMSEFEFRELLAPHFQNIQILCQYVHVGISINHDKSDERLTTGTISGDNVAAKPLAFIALCSRAALPEVPGRILFDQDADYIAHFMQMAKTLRMARLEAYSQGQRTHELALRLEAITLERDTANRLRREGGLAAEAALQARTNELRTLEAHHQAKLSSPRFLGRKFLRALATRLRKVILGR
jgi:2-polyprenyl-3-methyl-5-hydroxy-6-metoxy-1,4-benzoquinol methylase